MTSELQDLLFSDKHQLLDPEERLRKAPGASSESNGKESPDSPEGIFHGSRRIRPKMVGGHCMIYAKTKRVGVWEQELRAHVLVSHFKFTA